jgi:hypothetical protein
MGGVGTGVRFTGADGEHASNGAGLNQLMGPHDRRGEDLGFRVPVDHPCRGDGGEHLPGLGSVPGERFRTDDVLAVSGGRERGLEVQVVRQRDQDEIDVRAGRHGFDAIGGMRNLPAICEGPGALQRP